jgi:hypothetical protein
MFFGGKNAPFVHGDHPTPGRGQAIAPTMDEFGKAICGQVMRVVRRSSQGEHPRARTSDHPTQSDREGMANRRRVRVQCEATAPPQGEDKPSPLLWTGLASRFVSPRLISRWSNELESMLRGSPLHFMWEQREVQASALPNRCYNGTRNNNKEKGFL